MMLVKKRAKSAEGSVPRSPEPLGRTASPRIGGRPPQDEALLAISSHFEEIMQLIPDIIAEVDLNKIYVWMNQAGREFFGDDAIGKEAAFYFEGEQDVYNQVQPLFVGSPDIIYVESWQRRRDGEKRLLAWWCRALKDEAGNVTGAIATARDITASKRAEQTLRESEEKFRYVFDRSVIGKSITLPSGEINSNRALAEMLGYSSEELNRMKWQDITHPDDIDSSQKALDSILAGLKDSARFIKRYIRKDGAVVWGDVSTSLRRDADGRPLYFMTAVLDITERKEAEERLAANIDELRRWHEATLGRETRVLELKREVNQLLMEAGRPPRYASVASAGTPSTPAPIRPAASPAEKGARPEMRKGELE